MIPVVYSADQRREVQGMTYMDAKASTLNFSDGALHLRREAPIAARRQLEPEWAEALHERGGLATAGMVAVAARPEVLARPEVVAVNRPTVLGAIATPALRPGLELVDIVAETSVRAADAPAPGAA